MKKVLIGLLVLFVIIVVAVNFYVGSIVKAGVEKFGPGIVGVPVALDSARGQLLLGSFVLKGLTLGNPKGFHTDHAIRVERIAVSLDMRSLFRDTTVINSIHIKAPDINYELGLGSSNIGKILDGLSEDEEKDKKSSEAKVVIDDLLVEDGRVHVASKITGDLSAPVPLATIHMTDIGKDGGGASMSDVVGILFRTILTSVTGVVTGAGKLVGEGVGAVGGAAVDGVEAVGGAIGGLFGGDKEKDKDK